MKKSVLYNVFMMLLIIYKPTYIRVAEVEQKPTDLVHIGRFVACHAIH
jgi:hypothetical protein